MTNPQRAPNCTGNGCTVDPDPDNEVKSWDHVGGELVCEVVRATGKHAGNTCAKRTGAEVARICDGLRLIDWEGTCIDQHRLSLAGVQAGRKREFQKRHGSFSRRWDVRCFPFIDGR